MKKLGCEEKSIESMSTFLCQVISSFDTLQLKQSFSVNKLDAYRYEMYRCAYNHYEGKILTNVGSYFGSNGKNRSFRFENP